ncbi:MAG: RNA polymerase sigma-70 factor [Bacteroidota bacterium]|nr:RNA polymerase sigma-70 factor [Bacteroidota bacterium]MDP4273874.1 RNA polymerase sigma-70 factor [Bacteroidota bacterium]
MYKIDTYKGDNNFDELFRTYYKSLRTYACRYIGDIYIAEDIVQDVFFQIWERRETLGQIHSVRSYLFTAVFNRAANYLKHKKIEKNFKTDYTLAKEELEEYYMERIKDNSQSLLTQELNSQIKNCIELMPEQCRKVFLLSREKGLKNSEIADLVGISQKTVEKHITKALALLRESLEKYLIVFFNVFSILR